MEKTYIVVVQCHLVHQRCSGFHCEKAFHDRTGGFARYASENVSEKGTEKDFESGTDRPLRFLSLTCGGCCGRALLRKLSHLCKLACRRDGIKKEQIAVHFASCISKDNYHAPPCPHLGYLKTLVERLKLDWVEDSWISRTAETRRQQGVYTSNTGTDAVVISSPPRA
ncbi:MAG: CGGC domain-containing protein [Desulfuromonas sp.]|nr:CGGC domain-containing protein [Desulfuromonas sp.]